MLLSRMKLTPSNKALKANIAPKEKNDLNQSMRESFV